MSANKYFVLPAAAVTTAILDKLKNYGQTLNYLFIQDIMEILGHVTRTSNGEDYVILKVAQGTTVNEIRELIPGFNQGNDPFNRLYNDKHLFRTFLADNFEQPLI